MFAKFTRKDGSPIWLNANLIVTVEPAKGGGSVVVPVGDGLDYEVREGVDVVIAAVEGAQRGVAIVPVQPADVLPAAVEASPEASGEPAEAPLAPPAFEGEAAEENVSEEEAAAGVAARMAFGEMMEKEKAAEAKSKRTRKTKAAKPAASTTRRRSTRKAPLELSDEQLARLRKMAPRSVKKLTNSINEKQFAVADAEKTIKALVDHGIISIDEQTQHVEWAQQENA